MDPLLKLLVPSGWLWVVTLLVLLVIVKLLMFVPIVPIEAIEANVPSEPNDSIERSSSLPPPLSYLRQGRVCE